jgi:hypothetical protein
MGGLKKIFLKKIKNNSKNIWFFKLSVIYLQSKIDKHVARQYYSSLKVIKKI